MWVPLFRGQEEFRRTWSQCGVGGRSDLGRYAISRLERLSQLHGLTQRCQTNLARRIEPSRTVSIEGGGEGRSSNNEEEEEKSDEPIALELQTEPRRSPCV